MKALDNATRKAIINKLKSLFKITDNQGFDTWVNEAPSPLTEAWLKSFGALDKFVPAAPKYSDELLSELRSIGYTPPDMTAIVPAHYERVYDSPDIGLFALPKELNGLYSPSDNSLRINRNADNVDDVLIHEGSHLMDYATTQFAPLKPKSTSWYSEFLDKPSREFVPANTRGTMPIWDYDMLTIAPRTIGKTGKKFHQLTEADVNASAVTPLPIHYGKTTLFSHDTPILSQFATEAQSHLNRHLINENPELRKTPGVKRWLEILEEETRDNPEYKIDFDSFLK